MKAVFDLKERSGYKDSEGGYHFPKNRLYLAAARATLGDWALIREPKRNHGREAYVAAARVASVEPDPEDASHYYARLVDYLEFATPVPFFANGRYQEAPLRAITDRTRVGAAVQGRSLRNISDADFDAIVLAGLSETLAPENALRLGLEFPSPDLPTLEIPSGVAEAVDRRVEQYLMNRKIRDANFRLDVCRAYDDTCAVTGLKIINGGGRSEVQAAHIKPVASGGPDVVQNGLALSATVHWLFDRHLISVGEDYRLLVADNRVPSELRGLFRPHGELHLPKDERLWPDPAFLTHHRDAYAGARL